MARSIKTVVPPLLRSFRMYSARIEPAMAANMTATNTRRIFNEEHDMVRETARRFFNEQVLPYHDDWERQGRVPREIWQAAGAEGLLGAAIPEKYGGAGMDKMAAAIVWEEQAYASVMGPGFSIHSDIVLPYILDYGTEEQKLKYLPGCCSGDIIAAIAMTEPGAGSDLQGLQTTAVRDGDDYILNGSKVFISNGQLADVVVVVAKTDLNAKRAAHGLSLFLVDANTPGFSKGKNLEKMGFKAQDTSELFFEDCRIPASCLLGEENKGFYSLMTELPQERLLLGVIGVAHAETMYEWTRTYIKERPAFGKTLADLQTVRHTMAEMKTEIAVARAFADQCIEGRLTQEMASMAKLHCTELEFKVADKCVQLHGGWGYMWEYRISRAFVDARVQRIYGGANEVMKELIARSI